MFSATESFRVSGPSHLTTVEWANPHHRRAIAASLVSATYSIETDRQKNLQGPQALATPYWEFFHFKLNHILIDSSDHSIFGAVFEYSFQTRGLSGKNPPKYVVALRGTLIKCKTGLRDLWLDMKCIINRIHGCSRVQVAMQMIQDICSIAGHREVWIAGHSLGSAIGLVAGKNMAKLGFPIETYLFNPPFIAAPIDRIKEESLRNGIRIAGSVMKAGLSAVMNGHNRNERDYFSVLSTWFPYLFLNPTDVICSGYIGYFENRKKMEEIGAGKIEKLATTCSVGSILLHSEPYDLLPSAFVAVNLTPAANTLLSHGLEQWWNPNFHYRSSTHQFSR